MLNLLLTMLTDLSKLEKKLGVTFKNPSLLQEALTHRSYLNEIKEPLASNERLEFLGDAVLELCVSHYLFDTYPSYPEGKLTSLRSSIVNTKMLADVAKKLGLGNYLFLSKGEEAGGGRNNSSLLADVFEAVLGAVYLDGGREKVEKILTKFVFLEAANIEKNGLYYDYKSLLQEKAQERYRFTPIYTVIKEEGPDHAKTFYSAVLIDKLKIGEGKGKSKQEAEQAAAKAALEAWESK